MLPASWHGLAALMHGGRYLSGLVVVCSGSFFVFLIASFGYACDLVSPSRFGCPDQVWLCCNAPHLELGLQGHFLFFQHDPCRALMHALAAVVAASVRCPLSAHVWWCIFCGWLVSLGWGCGWVGRWRDRLLPRLLRSVPAWSAPSGACPRRPSGVGAGAPSISLSSSLQAAPREGSLVLALLPLCWLRAPIDRRRRRGSLRVLARLLRLHFPCV